MAKRPGMMVYFDLLQAMEELNWEQKGRLLEAMLRYGADGEEPELDPTCRMLWVFLRRQMDRDRRAYDERCRKSRYAVYCRVARREGIEPADYETWQECLDPGENSEEAAAERTEPGQPAAGETCAADRPMTRVHPDEPTTTPTATPTGTTAPTAAPTGNRSPIPAAAPARNRPTGAVRGFEGYPQGFAQTYPQLPGSYPQLGGDYPQIFPQTMPDAVPPADGFPQSFQHPLPGRRKR